MKEVDERDKLLSKLTQTQRELRYNEDQVKILEHMIPKLTRKERSHRLCQHGGMLDKFLREPDLLTDDEVYSILEIAFNSFAVKRQLDNLLSQAKKRILENH